MGGSAIEMVYDDCLQIYTKIDILGKQMRNEYLTKLLGLQEELVINDTHGNTRCFLYGVCSLIPHFRFGCCEYVALGTNRDYSGALE